MEQNQLIKLREGEFTDAVIAITYMCNSRCIMCNIWQYKGPLPLDSKEYLKLPSSLRTVNISGGEAFLRNDIADVLANIKQVAPKVKFKISTNGFAVELTRKRMLEIMERVPKNDIAVVVSIDGYEDKQIEVRRIPDGYNKNIATIKMLREIGIHDVTIAFTMGDYNYDHLLKMYQVANELNCEFTMAVLHNSDHYFQITTNKIERLAQLRDEIMKLARLELKTWNPKRWVRAFFEYGLVYYLIRNERILPNYAGRKAFFLDPNGFVYPADVSPKAMGNIKDFNTFQDMLDTAEARTAATKEMSSPHWMVCTARTAIQSHPFIVINWIFKSKFFPKSLKTPTV